jgi:hypothetical protein
VTESISVAVVQQILTPEFDQTPQLLEPSWFPRPTYNVSSFNAYESRTDLDSHADTTVLGKHCIVVHDTNRTADVSPFLPDLGTAEKSALLQALLLMITRMVKRLSWWLTKLYIFQLSETISFAISNVG